jgi:hypothetical protein
MRHSLKTSVMMVLPSNIKSRGDELMAQFNITLETDLLHVFYLRMAEMMHSQNYSNDPQSVASGTIIGTVGCCAL